MPRSRPAVTYRPPDPASLPAWATPAVVAFERLARGGQVQEACEKLRFKRQGGYSGVDGLLTLLAFFLSHCRDGLRPFLQMPASVRQQIAAVAARQSLCSAAALSRMLGRVTMEETRPVMTWLLWDLPNVLPVLKHVSAQARDARGASWHIFDVDGSMTVLRHRALPRHEDLPDPERRSESLAVPGYPGRKRGEVQFSRAVVQHAGSGLWINTMIGAGSGNHRAEVALAADSVVGLMNRIGAPKDHALLRLDGAYAGVPTIVVLRKQGIAFITRVNHPLLGQEDVIERLRAAQWTMVPDSGSGPRRSAAELGLVTLPPADRTPGLDGVGSLEPQTIRVVVSRFPTDKKSGAGEVHHGWQYELFAVDADPMDWTAAGAVALYYGRSGCENRLAQEDRELLLDRIFSYEPAGQELATAVGLAVWNYEIVRGFELEPPPGVLPTQAARVAEEDPRPFVWQETEAAPQEAEPSPEVKQTLPDREQKVLDELRACLGSLDWKVLLVDRSGWSFEPDGLVLTCPDHQALHLRCVSRPPERRGKLVFGAPGHTCTACPVRGTCMSTTSKTTGKQTYVSVDEETATRVKELLEQLPKVGRAQRLTPSTPKDSATRVPQKLRNLYKLENYSEEPLSGPLAPEEALFLPAEARRMWRELTSKVGVEIIVTRTPPRHKPRLIGSRAERRCTRLSWAERLARRALPDDARVSLTLRGTSSVVTTIMGRRVRRAGAGQASMRVVGTSL